ncbi:STAS domain-containing protein [Mycobacterium sp. NPDC048908]|uniref:STAS domain-containing protein n=1 Tax=Mycobacterium sp. NPDC048908 TaxID=3364292 RepID=UPI003716718B
MSTPDTGPASPGSLIEPTNCHTAHFATRWLQPSMAVIAAHGELDAANVQQFVDYALRHAAHLDRLVLDLTDVDFFGTAGFSALHTLNVRCAAEKIEWALASSPAVTRLMRICDPDSTLPIRDGVDAALAAVQGEPRRLLQLVPKSR